jgi:hypothetical protein
VFQPRRQPCAADEVGTESAAALGAAVLNPAGLFGMGPRAIPPVADRDERLLAVGEAAL